jgi:RHS repeat-associated protein
LKGGGVVLELSVRVVIDSDADIVEEYEYSTYGELTIKDSFGNVLSESAIGNRHTYTGREWDNDLDLYYYRMRWYDPETKRFTQKDLIHFTNRYIYVDNNPINFVDPMGQVKWKRGKPYTKIENTKWKIKPPSPSPKTPWRLKAALRNGATDILSTLKTAPLPFVPSLMTYGMFPGDPCFCYWYSPNGEMQYDEVTYVDETWWLFSKTKEIKRVTKTISRNTFLAIKGVIEINRDQLHGKSEDINNPGKGKFKSTLLRN